MGGMFLGVLRLAENTKFLIRGGIRCISRVFPGHFYCLRGPSLVELTGHDKSVVLAVTVQIRVSPHENVSALQMY